jgi:hypothetical protein
MNERLSIRRAAREHNWDACARIMFWQLFSRTFDEQKKITEGALVLYFDIWNRKHPDKAKHLPLTTFSLREDESLNGDFFEEIDPADNEFCNAILEYNEGISETCKPLERINHFATSIRSSVLAIQINRWIRDFPDQYERWRAGKLVNGPTFLDDKAAADDAQKAWESIDDLFSHEWPGRAMAEIPMNKIEDAYRAWERSLL